MNQASTTDKNLARLLAVEADVKAGNFRAAAAALDALAAETPADFRVHLAASLLGRAAGNPLLEIKSLQRATTAAPGNARVRVELAKALSRHGRHGEAVAAVNQALELAPGELPALEAAVAIADAAGNLVLAQRHLQQALAIRPADASIRRALGRNLTKQGHCAAAEPHLRAVLATNPDDLSALKWLSSCLIELQRNDEALTLLQRVATLAPTEPSLPYHFALAHGETPASAPPEMVRDVFDGYAHRFDAHLVGKLGYKVPERVAEIISQRTPGLDTSVLDLGCGTGLVGKHLGRVGGALVGIDLSPAMIRRAARLGVYSELRQGSLLDELRQIPPAAFDYVTAADVFIYVGDIAEVIPACFAVLRGGGALIFSCESADAAEGSYVLRPSKRYAHAPAAVEALCRAAGFERCTIAPTSLRLENNAPVAGFIAVAEKAFEG